MPQANKDSYPVPDPQLFGLSPTHPWDVLQNLTEIEAWVNWQHEELSQLGSRQSLIQPGVGLYLGLGGFLFLSTDTYGALRIEFDEDAAWVLPLIYAATKLNTPPQGRILILPEEMLLPLIWGLNTMIAETQLVCRKSRV